MFQIMIVEDNPVSGVLLKECAESEGFQVTGLFSSGEGLLEAMEPERLPDLILLDLGLPGISGIEVARHVKQHFPSIEIVIQTVFEDAESILGAIRAGASGYLLKADACQELRRAVEEVMAGGSSLSARVARRVLEEFKVESSSDPALGNPFQLTNREREILDELVQGFPSKIIADHLGISIFTVNNHLRKVYEKMRVSSRAEAVATVLARRGHF